MNVDTAWLGAYILMELECDVPIVEALEALWAHVDREIERVSSAGPVEFYAALADPECDPLIRLVVVARNGRELEHVPREQRSLELCWAAVHNDGTAIQYVPDRSPAMWIAAVHNTPYALGSMQDGEFTPEICREAVARNPFALQWLARFHHVANPDICTVAVQNDGMVIEHISTGIQTDRPDLLLMAVTQNGLALQHVYEPLRTPQLCTAAVTQNPLALAFVPHITPELRLIAVQGQIAALIASEGAPSLQTILETALAKAGSD